MCRNRSILYLICYNCSVYVKCFANVVSVRRIGETPCVIITEFMTKCRGVCEKLLILLWYIFGCSVYVRLAVLMCAVGADSQDTQHSRRLVAVDRPQHRSVQTVLSVICSS